MGTRPAWLSMEIKSMTCLDFSAKIYLLHEVYIFSYAYSAALLGLSKRPGSL
jgi:hypothetical protein